MQNQPEPIPTTRSDGFSWPRILKVTAIIIAAGIVFGSGYWVAGLKPVRVAWAETFENRVEHFSDCEHLPFYPQVEKAFAQHADVVAKVRAGAEFAPQRIECKNFEGGILFIKGQALLKYNGKDERKQAQEILGKDFFGIPYRGQPR